MALNYVWIAFFLVAFVVALFKLIVFGDVEIFKKLVDGLFDSAKSSVMDVAFPLTGTMVFFLGLLNIAEKAGAVRFLARFLDPLMRRIFPGVPGGHPAMGQMVMNFSANLLGLDNAATPFGLKAMESLQTLNPEKEKATNAQIMFLVLHTSGLTIIPLTIIAYRISAGSTEPASIFIPCVIGTLMTTLASVIVVSFWQRIKWDLVLIGWVASALAAVGLLLFYVNSLSPANKEVFSKVAGNILLFVIVVSFIVGGVRKKINVFDAFIEGAKEGFSVILKIIPYLVGMLVAIRVFRDSGALDYVINGISWCIAAVGIPTDFVPALPVAIMKPFSGSGARGMMLDIFNNPALGPDSFVGKTASIFQGSADTTFYIIALYFGSVGIKKVRYSIWAGMIADFIGVIAAIFIAYIFFR
ncbi:nucleoside recognition domain-containing protein [Flavihumibacter solisilvae]|uniref:Membrane protein n=1 Tax=Flavihumibacter solisilvae TaxID=1349421 RepID=A0A0C1IWK3_9BACT|nr:spore maturation protein [Flavihumibacter solisilvae]KIC94879.1 membrane protein [Flavihumibacter solisilvae]